MFGSHWNNSFLCLIDFIILENIVFLNAEEFAGSWTPFIEEQHVYCHQLNTQT